jgi:hypothetical protein
MFNNFPESLVELCWEFIRTWCFIVLHLENCILYFLFAELCNELSLSSAEICVNEKFMLWC